MNAWPDDLYGAQCRRDVPQADERVPAGVVTAEPSFRFVKDEHGQHRVRRMLIALNLGDVYCWSLAATEHDYYGVTDA